jgi:L-alanine-DL-glutamate epimerase-like enolase superfamily enzyme
MHVGFENPPVPENGHFTVPDGPGLGLRVREDEIERRRV